MGTSLPGCRKLFRAAGAIRAKGASRVAGGNVRKGHFAMFCFFLLGCVKNWYPPSRHLCKIFITPLGNLVKNGYPHPQQKYHPPLRGILKSSFARELSDSKGAKTRVSSPYFFPYFPKVFLFFLFLSNFWSNFLFFPIFRGIAVVRAMQRCANVEKWCEISLFSRLW